MTIMYTYRDEQGTDIEIPGFYADPVPALLPRAGDVIVHEDYNYIVQNWRYTTDARRRLLVINIRTMRYELDKE